MTRNVSRTPAGVRVRGSRGQLPLLDGVCSVALQGTVFGAGGDIRSWHVCSQLRLWRLLSHLYCSGGAQ